MVEDRAFLVTRAQEASSLNAPGTSRYSCRTMARSGLPKTGWESTEAVMRETVNFSTACPGSGGPICCRALCRRAFANGAATG